MRVSADLWLARALAWVGVWCVLLFSAGRIEAAEAPTEYQVKSAYLFNFGKFVEWPQSAFASAEAPFVIGIVGEDPFGKTLDELLKKKMINQRLLVVRRLEASGDLKGCQILFVSRSEKEKIASILSAVHGQPVLTISEIDSFCAQGGTVNFVLVNSTVKLEINAGAANAAGLKIRSNLLSLAKIINSDPERSQVAK